MNLYQASRCYLRKSQRDLKWNLILSALLLLLTLVALKPSSGVEDALLILCIALAQLVQMWLKYRSLFWFGKGDIPRRMDQLRSGLGLEPSAERCASIEQDIGKCEDPVDPNYWLSQKEPGPTRMVEMILESSFYTRALAAKCRNLFFGIGLVGLALALAALIVAFRLRGTASQNDFISHIVLTVLIFFLTGDFWNIGLLYRDLHNSADDSHNEAYALLRAGNIAYPVALEIALEYNTAVVQAPPLLSSKYLRSREATNEIFKRNYGKVMDLEGQSETQ